MSIEELGCDELMVGCCVGAGDGWTPDCGLQTPSPAPATSGSVVTRSQTRRRSGSRSSSATLQQITSHHHRLDTPLLHTHHHSCSGPWTMDRSCRILNTLAHFASTLSDIITGLKIKPKPKHEELFPFGYMYNTNMNLEIHINVCIKHQY